MPSRYARGARRFRDAHSYGRRPLDPVSGSLGLPPLRLVRLGQVLCFQRAEAWFWRKLVVFEEPGSQVTENGEFTPIHAW